MSRYDVFRRRIVPLVFFVALAFLVRNSCNKDRRTHATFVLDFGAAEHQVRAVDADLWIDDAPISHYHRAALDGDIGPTRFKASLPEQDGELHIDVDLGGTHRLITRHVHADENAVVEVPLERDLRP